MSIDLSVIPDDVRLARGDYSTVRAAHEDAKKALSVHCGALSSIASQVLRRMQPDNDSDIADVADLIADGRKTLDVMEQTTAMIESLAKQRRELKAKAWGK